MPTLTDPAVIKELLQRHGFSFSRALGQNFIINPGVCPKMAELGGAAPGVGVLEIGTGLWRADGRAVPPGGKGGGDRAG